MGEHNPPPQSLLLAPTGLTWLWCPSLSQSLETIGLAQAWAIGLGLEIPLRGAVEPSFYDGKKTKVWLLKQIQNLGAGGGKYVDLQVFTPHSIPERHSAKDMETRNPLSTSSSGINLAVPVQDPQDGENPPIYPKLPKSKLLIEPYTLHYTSVMFKSLLWNQAKVSGPPHCSSPSPSGLI